MTRFGEISPLWQNFKNIWQFYEGLIGIWQTFEPTMENSVCFWANLCWCKWQNIEQTFWASGHTGLKSLIAEREYNKPFSDNLRAKMSKQSDQALRKEGKICAEAGAVSRNVHTQINYSRHKSE